MPVVNVDEDARYGLEVTVKSSKITKDFLFDSLKKIKNTIKDSRTTKKNKNIYISSKDKKGKLKLNELNEKYKNSLSALPDNINKEQLKDYAKEFKKMGVDFSFKKVSKDSYSFFFSSANAELIEKGIKNVLEKKTNQKDNFFSMDNIKNLNKKILEKYKGISKDKHKSQSMER